MTPEQIERVKRVIGLVGEHPEFAGRFYSRLFAEAPEASNMFGDLEAQQRKLTDELASMVDLLGDLSRLDERAGDLGERHRGYGVRAGHYRLARAVMLETLDEVLGDDLTADDAAAWDRATSLITELMQAR